MGLSPVWSTNFDNMTSRNEYFNTYMKDRWKKRKKRGEELLGGKCAQCGSVENLEFDHIAPKTKKFTIGNRSSCSEKLFLEELAKCQLLCGVCHSLKSISDRGHRVARGTHGTLSSYRYCKCDLCREAKNKYQREAKRNRKYKRDHDEMVIIFDF